MSKPRVPSYHHHRPSGQAVVTLDGRDFYLGKWNTKASRTEYERLIGEWLANGRRLTNFWPCFPTAGDPFRARPDRPPFNCRGRVPPDAYEFSAALLIRCHRSRARRNNGLRLVRGWLHFSRSAGGRGPWGQIVPGPFVS